MDRNIHSKPKRKYGMLKLTGLSVFMAIFLLTGCEEKTKKYMDTELSFEERAEDLVSRMTLEEKISQMHYEAPAIERLGIPEYNWWNECLHGVGRAGIATVFPQAIGMSAMWDDDQMHQIATAVSDEARAKHHDFASRGKRDIYQGLTFWTPNINIVRDPRWGRGMETYGEDPYLSGELAVDYIQGMQGDDDRYLKLVATAKHFAVHSGPEPDRHRFDAVPKDRDFVMTYTPHFKKAIQEGGAYSVMCAYNRLNGDPCCGSKPLENLLREEWGFDGYIVSDCWAIEDFYKEGHHEVVSSEEEAVAMSVKAGTDLNCGSAYPALVDAVEQGLVTEEEIDVLVERLMEARMKLGMFDPEEDVPYTDIPYSVVDSEEHKELARDAARKSMVLLKNENDMLPLDKNVENVAVIGPNADHLKSLWANYNGYPSDPVTPLQGIKEKLPGANVQYAQGSRHAEEFPYMRPIPMEHLYTSEDMEENGLNGEYYDNSEFEGDPKHTRVDEKIDFTWWTDAPFEDMEYDNFSVKWSGYFVPPRSGEYHIGGEGFSAFKVYLDDELLGSSDDVHHPYMEYSTRYLEKGKKYEVRLEYQQRNTEYPVMKFLWDRPGQDLKQEALEVADNSDVVLMFMGLSPLLEGEEMDVDVPGFAGGDRTDIKLPETQSELIKEIKELGKPTVLVLLNGSALAFNWGAENMPAILEAWYPGQAGGSAIADVLFGDYNPAGRLPVTFYNSVDQLPSFEDYNMDGRTYKYFDGEPLYKFGHGLSYTDFEYSNIFIADEIEAGNEVTAEVDVTNTGDMAGEEVVQLYVSHPDVEDAPIRSLQGFKRISLDPGETKTVSFNLTPEQLAVFHPEDKLVVPEGKVSIGIGGAQPDEDALDAGKAQQISTQVNGRFVCSQ
ncbi:MAG: glycoside hydrolase family 3 C-terminal domain-containing protein [Marinilabiliaceae bacterium]